MEWTSYTKFISGSTTRVHFYREMLKTWTRVFAICLQSEFLYNYIRLGENLTESYLSGRAERNGASAPSGAQFQSPPLALPLDHYISKPFQVKLVRDSYPVSYKRYMKHSRTD